MNRFAENAIAFIFVKKLLVPFTKTEAYVLGLIDKEGRVVRRPKTIREKNAFTYLDRIVFVLKRLINKLPGGESKLKNILVAGALLRGPSSGQYNRRINLGEMMGAGGMGGGGEPGHVNITGAGVTTDQPVIRDRAVRNWKRHNAGMARRIVSRRRRRHRHHRILLP